VGTGGTGGAGGYGGGGAGSGGGGGGGGTGDNSGDGGAAGGGGGGYSGGGGGAGGGGGSSAGGPNLIHGGNGGGGAGGGGGSFNGGTFQENVAGASVGYGEVTIAPSGIYVALGDSYSAGLGSGGASSGTCLQNSNAYPALWSASHPAYQFTFAACSGATIATVQSTQLTAITAGTTLITLTAGGNPLFVSILGTCLVPAALGDLLCSEVNLLAQAIINRSLGAGLSGLYAAIRAQAATAGDPTAQLIVFGYPDFFQLSLSCGLALPFDSVKEAAMNRTVDVLDAAIAKAADASARTTFVDIRPAFATHELCSQAPWLNGIIPNNPAGSLHPNGDGQALGYEAALAAITG
jgi:hypothetical protein